MALPGWCSGCGRRRSRSAHGAWLLPLRVHNTRRGAPARPGVLDSQPEAGLDPGGARPGRDAAQAGLDPREAYPSFSARNTPHVGPQDSTPREAYPSLSVRNTSHAGPRCGVSRTLDRGEGGAGARVRAPRGSGTRAADLPGCPSRLCAPHRRNGLVPGPPGPLTPSRQLTARVPAHSPRRRTWTEPPLVTIHARAGAPGNHECPAAGAAGHCRAGVTRRGGSCRRRASRPRRPPGCRGTAR